MSTASDIARALDPLNLMGWIEEHREAFQPPVANKVVWPQSELIFQIIRGPNARNDFHVDPGDEIFYQLRGDIRVDVMDGGRRHTKLVHEGDVLLVPATTPHCPMRPPDSWGLVIERKRRLDEPDAILWFCESCDSRLHESNFALTNIETELKVAIERFNADEALRTCRACGAILPIPGPFHF